MVLSTKDEYILWILKQQRKKEADEVVHYETLIGDSKKNINISELRIKAIDEKLKFLDDEIKEIDNNYTPPERVYINKEKKC